MTLIRREKLGEQAVAVLVPALPVAPFDLTLSSCRQ